MFRRSKDGFLVYDPFHKEKERGVEKKHDCVDCLFCQMCSESRCNLCRNRKSRRGDACVTPTERRLSLREQIKLYDELNKL